jgi:hypothetical protein
MVTLKILRLGLMERNTAAIAAATVSINLKKNRLDIFRCNACGETFETD